MPQDRDCSSGAWTEEINADGTWLEVKKQQFEEAPGPPELTLPWVDEKALKQATPELPPLLPTILLPDLEAELAEDEAPPKVEHQLADHPEVEKVYERYRPRWEAWSTEHRRREAIQNVYPDLFHLHTQVRKQKRLVGETFETLAEHLYRLVKFVPVNEQSAEVDIRPRVVGIGIDRVPESLFRLR